MAVITISRYYGAGGRGLAERLARRLDYETFDKEIIRQAAEKVKVSSGEIRAFEKTAHSRLMRFLDRMVSRDFLDRILADRHGYVDEPTYVGVLKGIAEDLYAQDNIILLGRAGQYILKDHEKAWHILLVADLEHRLHSLMERYQFTRQQAEEIIRREDDTRRQILACFDARRSPDDPNLYDLAINMNRVTLEQAVQMVLTLIGK